NWSKTGSKSQIPPDFENPSTPKSPFRRQIITSRPEQRFHRRRGTISRNSSIPTAMVRKHKDEGNVEPARQYFTWTDELDKILVKCLISLAELKKVDERGKFNAGAYKDLERMMEEAKPGCGVKSDPNIMSRCKLLKQRFLALRELKGLSGARWDDNHKMVVIEDSVYADYVTSHVNCAKLNRVPFPYYDGLEFVFGKVCATGTKVVGLEELDKPSPQIEVSNNLRLGLTKPSDGESPNCGGQRVEEELVVIDDEVPPHTPTDKKNQSDNGNQSEATSRRKRPRRSSTTAETVTNEDDELKPMLREIVSSLRSMIRESDTIKKNRSMLLKEIAKIDGITDEQAMDAAYNLVKDADRMEFFYGLDSDQERKRFILRVLRAP
ncbi:hypothetical protein LINGRAHAP2_LOCUS15791, partial [Linum grandiflorum]